MLPHADLTTIQQLNLTLGLMGAAAQNGIPVTGVPSLKVTTPQEAALSEPQRVDPASYSEAISRRLQDMATISALPGITMPDPAVTGVPSSPDQQAPLQSSSLSEAPLFGQSGAAGEGTNSQKSSSFPRGSARALSFRMPRPRKGRRR
jgi:hypothetical protein